METINSPEQLLTYFANSTKQYVFASLTPIHLLGLQNYIKGLNFLNPIDFLNGQLPELVTPVTATGYRPFHVTKLLNRKSVKGLIHKRLNNASAAFLFFNQETEKAAKAAGLTVCFPPAGVREEIENKCMGKRIAVQAGVKTVPHLIRKVSSYTDLRDATAEGLGNDLVIQLPHGNSGLTTFFIANEKEYQQHAQIIERKEEVLIMKRLKAPSGIALEACITDAGSIVGVPMRETIGIPALTPIKGAWCGNQMGLGLFSNEQIAYMRQAAIKLCNVIKNNYPTYFGCIEFDFLLEEGDEIPYFGEINARLTGATPLSNQTKFPLFLFHLAQFEQLSLQLDITKINADLMHDVETWSSLIIKHLLNEAKKVGSIPKAGIYKLNKGELVFHRSSCAIADVNDKRELFLIPEIRQNDTAKQSDILLRVYLRGNTTRKGSNQLNAGAKAIVKAIRKTIAYSDK